VLARADNAEHDTHHAIRDHNKIRDALREVADAEPGSDQWWDAIGRANEENSDHMAEEEREGLTDFRRNASLQLRHDLAVKFAAYEARNVLGVKPVDKDPREYIAEHK